MSIILRQTARANPKKWGQYGYGGNNRTQQIFEILKKNDFQVEDIDLSYTEKSRYKRLRNGLYLIKKYQFDIGGKLKNIGRVGYDYSSYLNGMNNQKYSLFMQEEPPSYLSYYAAKDLGIPILCMPHNLETFVGYEKDYFSEKPWPFTWANEIKHIGLSDAVFCISREEQWLLQNAGINANYLPYYPPIKKLNEQLSIRKIRKNSNQSQRYLIIGTVENKPTYDGLVHLINFFNKSLNGTNIYIDLVGYSTDQLSHLNRISDNLKIHGTVTPTEMIKLQVETKCLLIYQPYGVGALTKIPESLIAGIPVMSNPHATRSAYGHIGKGITVFEDFDEMLDLMKNYISDTPPLLQPPTNYEAKYIKEIKKILS